MLLKKLIAPLLITLTCCALAQDTPSQPPSEPLKEAEKKLGVIQSEVAEGMEEAEKEQLQGKVEDLETEVKKLKESIEELKKKVNGGAKENAG